MRKAKTINLKDKPDYSAKQEYAKVSERLKLFREDCPNGLIETKIEISPDGNLVIASARVLKDKSNQSSAEATGHAVGSVKGIKAFEKQESISIGRALANLGYLASGEIATAEEMEDYLEYKQQKIQEATDKLNNCKTVDELKSVWASLAGAERTPENTELAKTLHSKLK